VTWRRAGGGGSWWVALFGAVLLAGVVSCSGSGPRVTASPKALARAVAQLPFDPAQLKRAQERTIGARSYYVFVPPHPQRPVPLFLVLHSLNTSAGRIASDSRFTSYAAAHHFAVAYGVGLMRAWNAGGCCNDSHADDMTYLINIVADVGRQIDLDRARVYVVGFSNGGMMAFRAACERPDIFAAAGVMSGILVTPCRPQSGVRERVLHVLQLQGAMDTTLPASGGPNRFVHATLPPISSERGKLPPGSELVLRTVPGLGHAWATVPNSGTDATAEFSQWLLARRL
jgi:poly(3-hydroxybutyrate) depolymerase